MRSAHEGAESLSPWHIDWIWSVAFAPEGFVLASAGSNEPVLLWKIGEAPSPAREVERAAA